MVAVNRIGEDGNALRYAGDSQVLDFQGDSLFNAADADGVFRVRLEAAALAAYRQRFPATWTRIASKSILECRNVRFRSMSEAMTRRCA